MKHVSMVLAVAILVFGLAMTASSQGMTGLSETAQANAKHATGVIEKIDPKTRTMTIRDFSLTANVPEPTGTPNEAANQQNAEPAKTTKVLKYSEHTNFASTNLQMNGRMSDLQVGDSVSLQVDDQNNILRIEEIAPQQNQQ